MEIANGWMFFKGVSLQICSTVAFVIVVLRFNKKNNSGQLQNSDRRLCWFVWASLRLGSLVLIYILFMVAVSFLKGENTINIYGGTLLLTTGAWVVVIWETGSICKKYASFP